ncbi:biotin/lipoyl-containing protein, partial [Staphylococcus sp. EG-SA-26]|uniref:biotin/lipoyl-containing protein n=1 Tax=Staphylococcus sp. EG-SA-26 TaxID=2767498 RepID=UPI0031FEBA5C
PSHIGAQMPGSVTEVKVSVGETVKANQPLLITEAMKMETTIQNELDERQQMLVKEKLNKQLAEETIDVSLPGRHIEIGSKH